MSARITLGSTLAGLTLLVIIGVVVITGSKANEDAALSAKNDSEAARIQSEQNNKYIQQLNASFHDFVDMWTERIKIGNTNTNNTQLKIDRGVENILGNLTSHRVITNQSFYKLGEIENNTAALTGPEYEKLADERVESIVGNLSEEHKLIFEALNITRNDNGDVNETQLGQLLKEFIQAQKVKPNQPQGPKS